MYLLKDIYDFISENHFGSITTFFDGKIQAIQAPFFIDRSEDGELKLYGQSSFFENENHRNLQNNEVLCVIHGPYTYISPSWLTEPNLPVWSHKTVQITGKFNILSGKNAWDILSKKVDFYEKNMDNPLKINDLPYILTNDEIEGICVFEILISNIDIKFELGQHYEDINYNKVIRELKKQDSYDAMLIAFEMEQQFKKRKKNLT